MTLEKERLLACQKILAELAKAHPRSSFDLLENLLAAHQADLEEMLRLIFKRVAQASTSPSLESKRKAAIVFGLVADRHMARVGFKVVEAVIIGATTPQPGDSSFQKEQAQLGRILLVEGLLASTKMSEAQGHALCKLVHVQSGDLFAPTVKLALHVHELFPKAIMTADKLSQDEQAIYKMVRDVKERDFSLSQERAELYLRHFPASSIRLHLQILASRNNSTQLSKYVAYFAERKDDKRHLWLLLDFVCHFFSVVDCRFWKILGKEVAWQWLELSQTQHKVLRKKLKDIDDVLRQSVQRSTQQGSQSLLQFVQMVFEEQKKPILENVSKQHPLRHIYHKVDKKALLSVVGKIPLESHLVLAGSLLQLGPASYPYLARLLKYEAQLETHSSKDRSFPIFYSLMSSLNVQKEKDGPKVEFLLGLLDYLVLRKNKMESFQPAIAAVEPLLAGLAKEVPAEPSLLALLYLSLHILTLAVLDPELEVHEDVPRLYKDICRLVRGEPKKKRKVAEGEKESPVAVLVDLLVFCLSKPINYVRLLAQSTFQSVVQLVDEEGLRILGEAIAQPDAEYMGETQEEGLSAKDIIGEV